jgi:hypothetical protein
MAVIGVLVVKTDSPITELTGLPTPRSRFTATRIGGQIAAKPNVDLEDVVSAERLVLGAVLLLVLWLLVNNIKGYTSVVMGRPPQKEKMTARQLEWQFLDMKVFSPDSSLHCEPSSGEWDYICTCRPVPATTPKQRVQFGVTVDAKRWTQTSPKVPIGAAIPHPGQQ